MTIRTNILKLQWLALVISTFVVPNLTACAQISSEPKQLTVAVAGAASSAETQTKNDTGSAPTEAIAPNSHPLPTGRKTAAKVRKIQFSQLKDACAIWLKKEKKSNKEDAIIPDDSGAYCNCFARNFLTLAEDKDDPAGEVKFFVEYYTIRDKKSQLEEELYDYFYATDEIEPSCLEDPKYKMKLH